MPASGGSLRRAVAAVARWGVRSEAGASSASASSGCSRRATTAGSGAALNPAASSAGQAGARLAPGAAGPVSQLTTPLMHALARPPAAGFAAGAARRGLHTRLSGATRLPACLPRQAVPLPRPRGLPAPLGLPALRPSPASPQVSPNIERPTSAAICLALFTHASPPRCAARSSSQAQHSRGDRCATLPACLPHHLPKVPGRRGSYSHTFGAGCRAATPRKVRVSCGSALLPAQDFMLPLTVLPLQPEKNGQHRFVGVTLSTLDT